MNLHFYIINKNQTFFTYHSLNIQFSFPSLLKMKAWFSLSLCHVFAHISHSSDLFKEKLQPVENSLKQQGEKTFNSCLVPCQGAKFSHWIKTIFLLLSIASHSTPKGPIQTQGFAKHNRITPSQLWQPAMEIGAEPGSWLFCLPFHLRFF